MGVKLYDGCWGVTREGEVVGPLQIYKPNDEFPYQVGDTVTVKRWRPNGTYNMYHDKVSIDIIAVFPSEASARAWLNRKPLLRRVLDFLHSRRPHPREWMWRNGWSYGMLTAGIMQGVIALLALLLTSCTTDQKSDTPAPSLTNEKPSAVCFRVKPYTDQHFVVQYKNGFFYKDLPKTLIYACAQIPLLVSSLEQGRDEGIRIAAMGVEAYEEEQRALYEACQKELQHQVQTETAETPKATGELEFCP